MNSCKKQSFDGHNSAVNSIQSDHSILYSSSTKTLMHDRETTAHSFLSQVGFTTIKYRNNSLFGCNGNKLYRIDTISKDFEIIHESNDEIQDFALHKNSDIVGLIDIDGKTTVLDTRQNQPIAKDSHDNLGSCILFRPTCPWQLFTGGFDCVIDHWDYSRPISDKYSFKENPIGDPLYNPPFCVSMGMNSNGNKLAVGLGDGNIALFHKVPRKKGFGPLKVLNNHSWSVSSLNFTNLNGTEYLISGGIDGNVCIWNDVLIHSFKVDKKVNELVIDNNDVIVCGADINNQIDVYRVT
jgi:WD40 repeat protein